MAFKRQFNSCYRALEEEGSQSEEEIECARIFWQLSNPK
jgi:hypothetical protein